MQFDTSPEFKESDLTVTVVVCTRNRPAQLQKCLEGVFRLTHKPDEVVVIDNSSGDDETEKVVRAFAATYVVEPIPGASRARNRGLAESHSEIVAYLDDDATPDVNWLGNLIAPFSDLKLAAVSGRVVTPQSHVESAARQSAVFVSNNDPKWFEIAAFGGLALASNMALRRRDCVGTRLFDERLGRNAPFQMGEEHYAFALILSRGYTAGYLPDAIVFHPNPTHGEVNEEARNSIAYAMLMFSEFPGSRLDLVRFLFRRLRRKSLTWRRDAPDPGEIVTSGWRVLLSAGVSAALLFFRTRKPRDN
ncbi:MAG TPA: glycosyltransferase family A protein [Terracidiphilus sp.]|jgi:glycosyltransferase involved in cell wall biosynthesis